MTSHQRLSSVAHGLDIIVEYLQLRLPSATTVKRIGGAFDSSELRRHVSTAPAVLIACLGMSEFRRARPGGWSMTVDMVAYVLTRDRAGAERDAMAQELVAEVLREMNRSVWDMPEAFGVPLEDSIEATNLYDGELDSVAVALWTVTWRQPFYLSH